MEYNCNKLNEYVINKIITEYDGKISLLVGRKNVGKIPTDEDSIIFDFFIPSCDEGYALAKTFIINDRGYDLFPMSWNRIESLSKLNEGISFCLADSKVLYAKNEDDIARFEKLRDMFFSNLTNKNLVYKKSLERINSAMDIYKNMMFEDNLCNIKKGAGGILQLLTEVVAINNGTYIKSDYEYAKRINLLKKLDNIPNNFISFYDKLIKCNNNDKICKLVHDIIYETREFIKKDDNNEKEISYNFNDLAGWYEEIRYTFRRILYACDNKDYEASFVWGCYLQVEFDILSDEAALDKMDLLSAFNYKDLSSFKEQAIKIENYILSEIRKHEVVLTKYNNIEEFLKGEK